MKFLCFVVTFLVQDILVFAGSGNGHASVSSLIGPTVNLTILILIVLWKIKSPLKSYFKSKAEELSNAMERANLKSKEAQLMLEGEKRKLDYLEHEIKSIKDQSELDVNNYEKKISKEVDDKIRKLKIDAEAKIKADKKEAIDSLNAELLNQVIFKTKTAIKTNRELQSKASSKLLGRI